MEMRGAFLHPVAEPFYPLFCEDLTLNVGFDTHIEEEWSQAGLS